jgi:hypothetical protein
MWTRSIRSLRGLLEQLRGLPERTGSFVFVAGNVFNSREFTARPTGSIFWLDRLGKLQGLAPSPWVLCGQWLGVGANSSFP